MTTHAQMKANRNNAKKSTGPRTEEGKTRSAQNALKHGLLARDTVLPGEDPAEFDSQLSALEADIQPANSLEFELVRQIADSQWRMRRLTRLETGFLAAAVDETRRYMEKRRPDELRPGYDGETLLLGSAMLDRTQAFVHLARYDGHLSRRFFRAVKQLRDLRHDERKAHEDRAPAGSYAPTDPYRGRYVPAQAPPPIDTPHPTAGRIGFRASSEPTPQPSFTQTTKQTQSRRTPMKSTASNDETRSVDLAVEIRGLYCAKAPNSAHSFVAHALSVPRRDSSRRLGAVQLKMTKQTQYRRTPIETTTSRPMETVPLRERPMATAISPAPAAASNRPSGGGRSAESPAGPRPADNLARSTPERRCSPGRGTAPGFHTFLRSTVEDRESFRALLWLAGKECRSRPCWRPRRLAQSGR